MAKYATLTDIASMLKLDYIYAEEAVYAVMPVFAKDKLMFPLRDSLKAVADYAQAHKDVDGFVYKSVYRHAKGSKLCDMWRTCYDRATKILDQLDAMEGGFA